jgi:hypothetical protein
VLSTIWSDSLAYTKLYSESQGTLKGWSFGQRRRREERGEEIGTQ